MSGSGGVGKARTAARISVRHVYRDSENQHYQCCTGSVGGGLYERGQVTRSAQCTEWCVVCNTRWCTDAQNGQCHGELQAVTPEPEIVMGLVGVVGAVCVVVVGAA
jgi:hypothetical protein